jgi:hypothetical protein
MGNKYKTSLTRIVLGILVILLVFVLLFKKNIFGILYYHRDIIVCPTSPRTNLDLALQLLYKDIGRFPTEKEGLSLLLNDSGVPNWKGPYVRAGSNYKFEDPWGNIMQYNLKDNKAILASFGPDRKQGTEDDIIYEVQLPK